MKTWLGMLCAIVLTAAAAGCQCHPHLLDAYGDCVDKVSDKKVVLDGLYTPCLDPTRIGRPDWCCCPGNRILCRKGCCRRCPPYLLHNVPAEYTD